MSKVHNKKITTQTVNSMISEPQIVYANNAIYIWKTIKTGYINNNKLVKNWRNIYGHVITAAVLQYLKFINLINYVMTKKSAKLSRQYIC